MPYDYDRVEQMLRASEVTHLDECMALAVACPKGINWSEASIATYVKIQAMKCGYLSREDQPYEPPQLVMAVMHCFPIYYTETPEGYARVRRGHTPFLYELLGFTRTHLTDVVIPLKPIDSVAAAVAPGCPYDREAKT